MKRPADPKESFDFCGLEDENYVSVIHCFTIKKNFFEQRLGNSARNHLETRFELTRIIDIQLTVKVAERSFCSL